MLYVSKICTIMQMLVFHFVQLGTAFSAGIGGLAQLLQRGCLLWTLQKVRIQSSCKSRVPSSNTETSLQSVTRFKNYQTLLISFSGFV